MTSKDFVTHIQFAVDLFNEYCVPELGFLPLSFESVKSDIESPFSFVVSLNKIKGEGVLFGPVHVALRRFILNGLPFEQRQAILKDKLRYSGVFSLSHVAFHSSLSGEAVLDAIESIEDIGMGHSIYKVFIEGKAWVIKKRDVSHQTFYTALLAHIGWASYASYSFKNEQGFWDISDFLEGPTVGQWLERGVPLSDDLIVELARHAALGDVLGRGDRHFDNYIFKAGKLLPIDVSYLFWRDNEDWVSRYLAGGMAEYSWLFLDGSEASVLTHRKTLFFEVYLETLKRLKLKENILETFIRGYYEPSLETDRKVEYLVSRLESIESYGDFQLERYEDARHEMHVRQTYKLKLQAAFFETDTVLDLDPLLKMYFFADYGRLSAFFLLTDLDRRGLLALLP